MTGQSDNQEQIKNVEGIQEKIKEHISMADAGINIPGTLYELGYLLLCAGNTSESINFYAKAVKKTRDIETLGTGFSPLYEYVRNTCDNETGTLFTALMQVAVWHFSAGAGVYCESIKHPIIKAVAESFFTAGQQKPVFEKSVLIISGGCGNLENSHENDLYRFRDKMRHFRGTIVSGGTTFGIAKIAGDLQEQGEGISTIGYVPDTTRAAISDILDTRYGEIRATGGKDFSPLEHLAFWIDFLSGGRSPRDVRLIGFNGGAIASCEYAISMMLGVHVGIVKNSGREADRTLADSFWLEYLNTGREYQSETANLFALDLDSDDIESFVMSPAGQTDTSTSG